MNHTLINRLSAHLWATPNGQELAQRLIRIAGDKFADADHVTLTIATDTPTLGDLARATGENTFSPTEVVPYYRLLIRVSPKVLVEVKGPSMVAHVKWEDA